MPPRASFPSEVWDGDTVNPDRDGFLNYAEVTPTDYDRLAVEMIATQNMLYQHEHLLRVPHLTSFHWERPVKQGENALGGGLTQLATANTINSGNTINITMNPAKLIIVVNSASQLGSFTVTGNTVSPLTGNVTVNDTETINVTALTTDGTTTVNNGGTKWQFTNAYITNETYLGDVVISTSDLASVDVDVYATWFYQNPGIARLKLDAVHLTGIPTNVLAKLDAILYSMVVDRTACTLNMNTLAHLEVDGGLVQSFVANQVLTLQRVGFTDYIEPANYDGLFMDVQFYPAAQQYWDTVMLNVWTSWYYAQTSPLA
jgi:hypothetical protein